MRDVARELEALRYRLLGLRTSLQAPTDEEGGAADLRAVIDCVLADSINPAIRDLRKAADGDDRLAGP